jgi:hypothetical protein
VILATVTGLSASILAQAIHLSLADLVVGFGVAIVLGLLFWLIAAAQKDGPERERPEPVEPVDLDEEIKVYRHRKDAEFMAGPEGRDRLPLTGRRFA